MKSRIQPQYSRRDRKIMAEYINKQIEDSLSKVQWLMLLAFNSELGIGEKRILAVMNRYSELLEEYKGYQKDEIADAQLSTAIKKILPNTFTRLYQ